MAPYRRFASSPSLVHSALTLLCLSRVASIRSVLCRHVSLRSKFPQVAPGRRFAPPLRFVSSPFYLRFVFQGYHQSAPHSAASYPSAPRSPSGPVLALRASDPLSPRSYSSMFRFRTTPFPHRSVSLIFVFAPPSHVLTVPLPVSPVSDDDTRPTRLAA